MIEKDKLFLLRPGFTDPAYPGDTFYCWHCALMEGVLASFPALAGRIDVLFVGTGAEIAHAPRAFRDRLEEAGIGVETMATPAACRTYNVLLSEGRRVAVALLPV